jgi:hypothetical protein
MVKAICAHCKSSVESKELQLITQNDVAFYGCKSCFNLYAVLDRISIDMNNLDDIDKASGNDIPG